jgi:hypothetical protein
MQSNCLPEVKRFAVILCERYPEFSKEISELSDLRDHSMIGDMNRAVIAALQKVTSDPELRIFLDLASAHH